MAFIGRLPPQLPDRDAESLGKVLFQFGERSIRRNQGGQFSRFDQFRQADQLPRRILEDLFNRQLRRSTRNRLSCGDLLSHDLQHVVEQQAERSLKDRGLRRRANQLLQRKDLGDLLKDLLDAPAMLVRNQQVRSGILSLVQQVGDDDDFFLAGTLQSRAPHRQTVLRPRASHPTPFVDQVATIGVLRRHNRPRRIQFKVVFGMIPDHIMVAVLSQQRGLREIANPAGARCCLPRIPR